MGSRRRLRLSRIDKNGTEGNVLYRQRVKMELRGFGLGWRGLTWMFRRGSDWA